MQDQGNAILLEDGFTLLLETTSVKSELLQEKAPAPIAINNYEFVKVGDGMATGEKIR